MKKVIVILLAFICIQNGFTQIHPKSESIQNIFDYLTENKLFNGAALVVHEGQVVYNKASGYANMEWKIPNTIDTKFDLCSVTKQFTAVLIMQLVTENKINLNDTISKYLPEMPRKFSDKITIHQLLTHTSGLPSPSSSLPDYYKIHMKVAYTFEERLKQIQSCEFEFKPGTSWSYSGFGYSVLGQIIANVTNESLEENFKERIFEPLKMTNSGVFIDSKFIPKRAYNYQMNWDNSYIPSIYSSQSPAKLGGGGLYSTIEDLLKWHEALQENTLLSEEMKKIYFTPHFQFDESEGYCYGNFYKKYKVDENKNVDVYYHSGGNFGFSSLLVRVPENNLCIILLHNGGLGYEEFYQKVATEILNVLYDKEYQLPKINAYWVVAYTAMVNTAEELKKHYRFLKENMQDVYIVGPEQLNTVAKVLMQFNKFDIIEDILKLNIEEYPKEYSVYYELGKFYAMNKEFKNALEYLNKALELAKGVEKEEVQKKILEINQSMEDK